MNIKQIHEIERVEEVSKEDLIVIDLPDGSSKSISVGQLSAFVK